MRKIIVVVLLIQIVSLPMQALDSFHFPVSFSAGILLDVAPFGIEKTYWMFSSSLSIPGNWLAITPSVFFSKDSWIFRLPVRLQIPLDGISRENNDGFSPFLLFAGAGLEFYDSTEFQVWSPVITGGIRYSLGSFFMEVPVSAAFRKFNTDSDISLSLGYQM